MIICRSLLFFSLFAGVFTCLVRDFWNFRAFDVLIFKRCKGNHKTIIVNDNCGRLNPMLHKLHEPFHSSILLTKISNTGKIFSSVEQLDDIILILQSNSPSCEIELYKTIKFLSKKSWWNIMTPIYLLHLPLNDCGITMKTLRLLSKKGILTSYYICIENDEVQIYTYNPFTNRAPSSWTEVQRSSEEPNWTLYRRQYHAQTICQELDFDRTTHLDGYPITIAAHITYKTNRYWVSKSIDYKNLNCHEITIDRGSHSIIDALVMTLNASARIFFLPKDDTKLVGISDKLSNRDDISIDLILLDYSLSTIIKDENKNFVRTYPLIFSENRIATHNRGYQTLAEKVWNFYGFWTILFTIFVLFVTFIVIWYSESKKTSFAVFEIIRLLISHNLYTRMDTLPRRIFFITVLIYFLIIQATFNGHLAKFLTKPELRKHAETIEDLKDLGYQIYDSKHVKKHIAKTENDKKLYSELTKLCLKHILSNDSSVACIFNHNFLLQHTQFDANKIFYISKRSSRTFYSTALIRNPWLLSNRVNTVMRFVEEFGFRQLDLDSLKHSLTHNLTVAEAKSEKDFQPIMIENLMFAFSILAIGLSSAIFCFCVEIFINHKSKWNKIPHSENVETETLEL